MTIRSVIRSCGAYLPEKTVTNADLAKQVETSDEWIFQRTGIRERRIAGEHETTSFMATAAARQALERERLTGADIDGIVVATATPDRTFPSVACSVQSEIGGMIGPAFDVEAACSGFIYALATADNFIKAGQCQRMLVIGAEKFSSIVNWQDRTTCVLFGDGAGAIILEASEGRGTIDDRGVLSTHLRANGTLKDILYTDGGTALTRTGGHIVMEGKDVFRHAVNYMSEIVEETLRFNGVSADQIDWLVPHQANSRIIEATAKKLSLPMEQVILTVARHGNTSAASVPLALAEGVADGRIKRGDLLLMEALGAGLTWASALVRF